MSNLDPQHNYHPYTQTFVDNKAAIDALAANATELNTIAANAPGAALTVNLTALTVQSAAVADYSPSIVALSDQLEALSASTAACFETADAAKTVLAVLNRQYTRVNELEARLKAQGLLS